MKARVRGPENGAARSSGDDPGSRLLLLKSWPYMKGDVVKLLAPHADRICLLVDSGAVTAFSSGKTLSVDEYCRFLEKLPIRPWGYLSLDEIGNPRTTWRNYTTMLKRGFTPIPVYTRNDSPERLDECFQTSLIVAVGGLATRSGSHVPHMFGVVKRAGGRKIHLLGMTGVSALKTIRPFSADSSSWESAARYGNVVLYMGNARMRKLDRKDVMERPSEELLHRVKQLGCDPYALRRESAWRGGSSETRAISAASWVALSRDMKRQIGTHLFLASTTVQAGRALLSAYIYQTEGARL
ncbi:MAG: hypothetical protein A3J75_04975 [Acidobacteria bacterium RBG_16_68_9]|nr:MAG: hypothetical protein A3J75_04975 [Acidobacteria bacterium RBG_16_68_9]